MLRQQTIIGIVVISISTSTALAQKALGLQQLKGQLAKEETSAHFIPMREKFIDNLVKIVADNETPRSTRVRAVQILGKFRAAEATEVLVRHVDKIIPETILGKTVSSLYPCVPALIKVGKPSSRAVLKELRKPMKGTRRLALAVVLAGVEGRQVGRFMLQHEIAKAKTPEERRNLQASMNAFLAMTANERTAEELKAEERAKDRKNKRPAKRRR